MKPHTRYMYCICRLDRKYWHSIDKDLKSRGYKNIRIIIPTVKILKKTKDGKNYYDEVPLLFNYGFVRMTSDKAYDRQFLIKLRKSIPGISGWLRSLETMHPRKKKARIDNAEDWDDFSIVATLSRKEVKYYKRLAKKNKIYSKDDISSLHPGDYITLRGYPIDGIGAVVKEVNLSTERISLCLYPDRSSLEIQLPLDNVLYSIYGNYDEDLLLSPNLEKDITQIEDGEPDTLLEYKQY